MLCGLIMTGCTVLGITVRGELQFEGERPTFSWHATATRTRGVVSSRQRPSVVHARAFFDVSALMRLGREALSRTNWATPRDDGRRAGCLSSLILSPPCARRADSRRRRPSGRIVAVRFGGDRSARRSITRRLHRHAAIEWNQMPNEQERSSTTRRLSRRRNECPAPARDEYIGAITPNLTCGPHTSRRRRKCKPRTK